MIYIAHITLFSALYAVFFAFRNYWQLIERNAFGDIPTDTISSRMAGEGNKKWHNWQGALQTLVGVFIGIALLLADFTWLQGIIGGLQFGLTFWIVFDSITGWKLTGNMFYLGSTATLDKITRKIGYKTVWGLKLALVAACTSIWIITFYL